MQRAIGVLVSLAFILAPWLSAQVPTRAVPTVKPPAGVLIQPPQPTQTTTPVLTRMDDATPPAGLTGTPAGNGVALVWSSAPQATGYIVLRSAAAAGPFNPLTPAAVPDTQYTDAGVSPGTTYFYAVTAQRPDGHFGTSTPIEVAVPADRASIADTKAGIRDRLRPGFQNLDIAPSAGWGFADLHTHQVGNLGFGGGLIWGDPFGDPAVALKPCDPAHGLGGTQDLIGNAMTIKNEAGGGLEHHTGGYPHFDGWPTWYGTTHQQMYVDWLKRAVDGGLRLMVVDAVNNQVFCDLAKRGAGRTCDDMEAVNLQIDQVKQIERSVDDASGGPGQGWYRIAYNAKQARDAVSQGKLAVVIGIEVDQVFNCGNCTPMQIRGRLQNVYDKGVRKLIPIHLADNNFGGAALYNPLFSFVNYKLHGKFFDAFDCSNMGLEFQIDMIAGAVAKAINIMNFAAISNGLMPAYTLPATCNANGLTPAGVFLIHEMMSKHMIIDVAHMGLRSLTGTLAITDSSDYPVVASHSSILDASLGEGRSERALSDAMIAAIRKNGGLIGIGIGGGKRNEIATRVSRIANDCGKSSKAFAQHYLTALGQVKGEPVAFGSDLNGLETMTAPRFGPQACGGDVGGQQNTMVSYPFTAYRTGVSFDKMQFGDRTFDFNTDGFTQVGMYPDLIQDYQNIGLTPNDLDPLFRSADAFVRLWEKAESKNVAPLLASTPTLALTVSPRPPTTTKQKLVVTAKDRETGEVKSGSVTIYVVTPRSSSTVPGSTGQVISYSPCLKRGIIPGSPTTAGSGDAVTTCGGVVKVAGYPDASFTTPPNPDAP